MAVLAAISWPGATTISHADVLEISPDGEAKWVAGAQGAEAPPAASTVTLARAPSTIAPLLERSAAKTDLSADLLEAVAWAESRFEPHAVSPKGAVGPMQLMEGTARELGVDAKDPAQNVDGGARYLRQMLDEFGGDIALALSAYNAGPGAVRRHGAAPYQETHRYVNAVLEYMAGLAEEPK